jgi:hypothetical protein
MFISQYYFYKIIWARAVKKTLARWWPCTPVICIPAFQKLRQEDYKFEVSLGYVVQI